MKVTSKCAQWFVRGALLLMALVGQAQTAPSLPKDQYGAIIAPDPKPERRELGKQVLDQILDVVLTISLSEPEKVIQALGFQKPTKYVYPEFEAVWIRGQAQGATGQGHRGIHIYKYTNLPPESKKSLYYLSTSFNLGSICIHVDDALARLKPVAEKVVVSDLVRTGPYPFAPQQKIDALSFWDIADSSGRVDLFTLVFAYQYCANSLAVHYTPKSQKE